MKNRILYKMLLAFGLKPDHPSDKSSWRGTVLGRKIRTRRWVDPEDGNLMLALFVDDKKEFAWFDQPSTRLRVVRHLCAIVRRETYNT